MKFRRLVPLLMIIMVLPSVLIFPSRAQPVQVTVGQSTVTMKMGLVLRENLTGLPKINTSLNNSNNTSVLQPILQPINASVSKLVPGARVTDFQLRTQTLNSSGTELLIENYSLTISGANQNLGSSIRANLAFISMNVSQSLIIANQEINTVGSTYLLAPLNAMDPSTTEYFIDGHQTLSAVIPAETTKTFWLLDFTWVTAVSTWPQTQDLVKQTTSWTFDQGAPRYNLTLGRKSPEGPLITVYMATYYPSFTVTLPATGWTDGNTIAFDLPTNSDVAMPIIAIVALATLLITLFLDKRLASAQRAKRRK